MNNIIQKENFVVILTTIAFCFLLATFMSNSKILIKGIYFLAGICLLIVAGFILKKSQKVKKQIKLKNTFRFKWDFSVLFLIAANIITIILAITQNWSFLILFFIYWCQSVIIGLFNIIKILNLKDIKAEDIALNGGTLEKARVNGAIFFLFLFLILYGVYLRFILNHSPKFISILFILLSIGLFFLNHLFSFIKNFKHDTEKKQGFNGVLLLPFIRTLPMHLIILFGFILLDNKGIVIFLLLKTIVDIIMHNWEHRD